MTQTPSATPRLSILIPNYNNGRESSRSGDRDLIAELLQSLWDTLVDETIPFEIIAYDDGSTDDSLATLRAWSQRSWPDGRAFLELIEAEHCGVLARTANVLSRRARGQVLARLDGDVVCLTPQWVSKICEVFEQNPPKLGVVGPKQLRPDGKIHAFGDWILHPNGYTHLAAGLDRFAVEQPVEVDHVMGCFYCCKKEVFDQLDGYDEQFLRGQTIDFGLRARLEGWSCIAVPHVEFVHNHGLRTVRATEADSQAGVRKALEVFRHKWGFDRVAPDLDEVRRRYSGTPLLWNAQWFGVPVKRLSPARPAGPIAVQHSDWGRYTSDKAFQSSVDLRAAVALDVAKHLEKPYQAVLIGSGVGLVSHLLALHNLSTVGIESVQAQVEFARKCVSGQTYPSGGPTFVHQQQLCTLPLSDAQADLVLMFDQIERHPNPVGLLGEARRCLKPGGMLVIVSPRAKAGQPPPWSGEHPYTWPQLLTQVQSVGGWGLMVDPSKDDPARDMILVARRLPETNQVADDPISTGPGKLIKACV